MRTRQIAVFAVIAALSLCGCGTICNFAGKPIDPTIETRVYGGVQLDFEVLDDVASNYPDIKLASDPKAAAFFYPLAVVDPLLSFVGDTLTFPVAMYVQRKRERKRARPPVPVPGPVADPAVLGKPVLSGPETIASPPVDGAPAKSDR